MAGATAGPPVIDVRALVAAYGRDTCDPASLPEGTAEVARACEEWGFFQCVNHGIDEHTLDEFDTQMRTFFNLERQHKAPIKRTSDNSRGWFDDELTKRTPDWKECIDIGQPGESKIDGFNQWPSEEVCPGFRRAMEAYYTACITLSRVLLRTCAVALGMPPSTFDAAMDSHSSYLRLNYYPLCPSPVGDQHPLEEPDPEKLGRLGINKHTDAGCVTVLRQYADEPASLQVYREGRWWRVVPAPGAVTINIGDMMQVWSNNKYVAPIHRVLADPTRLRYSAPFFYNPSYTSSIAPVPSAGVPKYRPLSWAEFRRRRFEGDFSDKVPRCRSLNGWLMASQRSWQESTAVCDLRWRVYTKRLNG